MIEKYVDSKELKRMLSTLLVIVGCLIIAALFASIVVPGLRNANKPATPTAVDPVTGETGWLDPAEFPADNNIHRRKKPLRLHDLSKRNGDA